MPVSTVENTLKPSNENPRLKALREKHKELSKRVDDARKQLSTTDFYLSQLKKQKLIAKEKLYFEKNRASS